MKAFTAGTQRPSPKSTGGKLDLTAANNICIAIMKTTGETEQPMAMPTSQLIGLVVNDAVEKRNERPLKYEVSNEATDLGTWKNPQASAISICGTEP